MNRAKGKIDQNPESSATRQKAEMILKSGQFDRNVPLSESETLKLIYELEVHQIELELQNEELTLANERTELAKKKYLELYDFAPTGYFTLSKEGKIIDLNLCGSQMLGKERVHIKGDQFSFYISGLYKSSFQSFLERVFQSKVKESLELLLGSTSSTFLYVKVSGIIAENDEHCFVTLEDITQRKRVEEKLKESERILLELNSDKDRFISILAHDLKSPFSALLGFSNLLVENIHSYTIEEIEERIRLIHSSTQSVLNLLEDTLLWARSQSGKIPFEPQKLNLKEISLNILSDVSLAVNYKNLCINNYLPENLEVVADLEMLKTILRNLISNAVKFTHNDGLITISAILDIENVVVSISDDGVGITPERISQLFNDTHTNSTKGTANEGGTGLGLLLCKQFVERHGGKIWAEKNIERGSNFKFSLPIVF